MQTKNDDSQAKGALPPYPSLTIQFPRSPCRQRRASQNGFAAFCAAADRACPDPARRQKR